jgi:hypothetical protein
MLEEKFYWRRKCVFFLCGAMLGTLVAMKWMPVSGYVILAAAVAFGFVSAICGDRFWYALIGAWWV